MDKVATRARNGLNIYADQLAKFYTDGACSGNGQEGARAGIGVFWPNNPSNNISEPFKGRQTNQCAEIAAAIRGIKQAKDLGYCRVHVLTDSHYVKNAAEAWIPNWERNGWRRPVANIDLFRALREVMLDINTTFEYVPSQLNRADPLARRGAASQILERTGLTIEYIN